MSEWILVSMIVVAIAATTWAAATSDDEPTVPSMEPVEPDMVEHAVEAQESNDVTVPLPVREGTNNHDDQ